MSVHTSTKPSVFAVALLCIAVSAGAESSDRHLIEDVRVWNGTSDEAVSGLDVLIDGELIIAIGEDIAINSEVVRIDGRGGTLIPGIIDAHVHLAHPLFGSKAEKEDPTYIAALSIQAAHKLLMRGWTTARDIGGPSQGLAKAIDEGIVDGPRVYTSAQTISQTSGHGDSRGINDPHPNMGGTPNYLRDRDGLIADGPDEVRRAVREALRHGATAIKVMAGGGISSDFDPLDTKQYSIEELRAAVEAAADWNTYVAVHAYTDDAVLRSLEAGVKVIEHGHLLTETGLRKIRSAGAYLSSQSFGFVRTLDLPQGTPMAAKSAQVMDGVDNMMSTAKKLGIPVAFGTDAFGSMRAYDAAVHEFGYRQRWFSSLEILKQATSHNAKLLELTGPRNPYQKGPLGVIEVGAYADLLIVDGDPLSDVTLLEDYEDNIKLIMKGGRIYKDTLDSMNASFDRFRNELTGHWDNEQQAKSDAANGATGLERHPRRAMTYVPIDNDNVEGQLFAILNYTELGFEGPLSRVSLHRFRPIAEKKFVHEFMFLKDPDKWGDLGVDLSPLTKLVESDVRINTDCAMHWEDLGTHFEGKTLTGKCITSSFTPEPILVEGHGELRENLLIRHDQNFSLDGTVLPIPGGGSPELFKRTVRQDTELN